MSAANSTTSGRSMWLLLAAASSAWAAPPTLPGNPTVIAGSAIVAPGPSRIDVTQSTARAIINWSSFSIGSGGTVRFVQPSSTSAVLNRVLGADPSSILGTMTANGQVFLVNPNGIFVGATGRIDAAGITLSTANIADGDFMAGNIAYDPTPSSAPLEISGTLVSSAELNLQTGGGPVHFTVPDLALAPALPPALTPLVVPTFGTITLPGGSLVLAAGGGVPTPPIPFDISTGGSISIVQRSTSSAVVNRLVGSPPSSLLGSLMSTGRAFLISPRGALVPAEKSLAVARMPLQIASMPQPATLNPVFSVGAPAPARAPRPLNDTASLADGVVTVRLPLVEALPIALN